MNKLMALMVMFAMIGISFSISCTAVGYNGDDPTIAVNCSGAPSPDRNYVISMAHSTDEAAIETTHTNGRYVGIVQSSSSFINFVYHMPPGFRNYGIYTVALSGFITTTPGAKPRISAVMANCGGQEYAWMSNISSVVGCENNGGDIDAYYVGNYANNASNSDNYANMTMFAGSGTFSVAVTSTGKASYKTSFQVTQDGTGLLSWNPNEGSSGGCAAGQVRCLGATYQVCNATVNAWQTMETCSVLCSSVAVCTTQNSSLGCTSSAQIRCNGANLEVCNPSDGRYFVQTACSAMCPGSCFNPSSFVGTVADLNGNINAISPLVVNDVHLLQLPGSPYNQVLYEREAIREIDFRVVDNYTRKDYAPMLAASDWDISVSEGAGLACTKAFKTKTTAYPSYIYILDYSCNLTTASNSYLNVTVTVASLGINLTTRIDIVKSEMALDSEQFYYVTNGSNNAYYFKGRLRDRFTQVPIYNASCGMYSNTSLNITNGVEVYCGTNSISVLALGNSSCTVYGEDLICSFGSLPVGFICSGTGYSGNITGSQKWFGALTCTNPNYNRFVDRSIGGVPVPFNQTIKSIECKALQNIKPVSAYEPAPQTPVECVVEFEQSVGISIPDYNRLEVSVSPDYDYPLGFMLISWIRNDMVSKAPVSSFAYNPYEIIYKSHGGAFESGGYFSSWHEDATPVSLPFYKTDGYTRYVYRGIVPFATGATGATKELPLGRQRVKNAMVYIMQDTATFTQRVPLTYGFFEYNGVQEARNSIYAGKSQIMGQPLQSGDFIECWLPFSDPQGTFADAAAEITEVGGKTYKFSISGIQSGYGMIKVSNTGGLQGSGTNMTDLIKLQIPNWGGCFGNVTSDGYCNGTMSNYTFDYSQKTSTFTCNMRIFNKFGLAFDGDGDTGTFTNSIKPMLNSNIPGSNINIGDFATSFFGWMFAKVENFMLFVVAMAGLIVLMPIVIQVINPGWSLLGNKKNE